MQDKEKDFLSTVSEAGEPIVEHSEELDNPSVFSKQENPFVKPGEKGSGPRLNYHAHSRVFTIWRDWETCSRCKDEMKSGSLQLPKTGDYTCPHVQNGEFKEVMDEILSGRSLMDRREYFYTDSGARCVHVTWLTPDQETVERLKKAEAYKEEHGVWPPNLKKAFEDPVEAKKRAVES